jgi:hypothetical protein
MAKITGILCQVVTGDFSGAGTDGRIFLGLAGREFRLDSSADDFERGSLREYVMGRGPVEPPPPPQVRVANPGRNDPRVGFPLDTATLSKAPVYIRFEPGSAGDAWNVSFAAALVFRDDGVFAAAFFVPEDFDNLWMGKGFGEALHLTETFSTGDLSLLERGRRVAAKARK